MSLNDAREYHTSQVHYLRVDFTFSDEGVTSIGWLPDGAVVHDACVVVSTAFNSGTSDTADLGYRNSGESGISDDVDEWATLLDLTAAGYIDADEIDASVAELYFVSGAEAVLTYTSTGTAPTTGAGHAIIFYTIPDTTA